MSLLHSSILATSNYRRSRSHSRSHNLLRLAIPSLLLPLVLAGASFLLACEDTAAKATTANSAAASANATTTNTTNTGAANAMSANGTTDTAGTIAAADSDLKVSLFFLNYSLDPKDYFNGWILVRVGAGETLLRLNDQGQVQPALARDFQLLSPLSYQLTLHEGVKFSDGSALTAHDVKLNLERVMALNPRTVDYFSLDHIEVINDHKLVIHTTKPVPELFTNLCEPLFSIIKLPAAALPAADGTWPQFKLSDLVTTGPYKVTNFVPNEKIEVAPNPFYHGLNASARTANSANTAANSANTANAAHASNATTTEATTHDTNATASGTDSRYSHISYFYMPDAQNRIMALQAGEVDLIPTVDYANLALFADQSRYQVLKRISPRTNVVYINHANPLLAVAPIRQAISLAVNREHITTLIGGQAAAQLIAPAFVNAKASHMAHPQPTFDLMQAQKLLDEAGIVDSNNNGTRDYHGQELSFKYYLKADHGSADSSLIAQSIQQDLKPLQIDLQLIPSENLAAVVAAGTFDFYSANDSTAPTGEPYYFLASRFSTKGAANYGHYHNQQVDDLLGQMQQSFTREQRLDLTQQILDLLSQDQAALFINHIEINEVATTKLHNLHLYSFDYYFIDDQVSPIANTSSAPATAPAAAPAAAEAAASDNSANSTAITATADSAEANTAQ